MESLILPLSLSFQSQTFEKKVRLKIFDDFGTLITDQAFLNTSFPNFSGDYRMIEIPTGEIKKILNLKSNYLMAQPFLSDKSEQEIGP